MPLSTSPCVHLNWALENNALRLPRATQQVYKDECTLCFDDQDGPNGIDVCLDCYNGGCCAASKEKGGIDNDRQHSQMHHDKTRHTSIVINVKRRLKKKEEEVRTTQLCRPIVN